jgi:hypothetical protein
MGARGRLYDFLDVQLPRFACVILLFVAVYSMFLYINYRDSRRASISRWPPSSSPYTS